MKFNKNLAGSIFSYSSAIIISQICMALYTLALIWWLSTEDYGIISANYAVPQMFAFAINLGLNIWLVRTIPTKKNSKNLTGIVITYKLLAGIIWAIIIFAIFPLLQPGIYQSGLLILAILDIWLDSIFTTLVSDLIGHKNVIQASILFVSSRILRIISIGLIISLNIKTISYIILFRLFSTLIIVLIALIISKPVFKSPDKNSLFIMIRQSIIFNASEILNILFINIDLNLLTWINGNPNTIGGFAIASSLINMISSIPTGVSSLLLPTGIETFLQSWNIFKKKMKITLFGFFVLSLLLWGSVQLLRINNIQSILGENYEIAISIIIAISPVVIFRTLNQFNVVYLLSTGAESKQLLPQIGTVLLKFLVGIILISKFKLLGIIWVSIASEFMLFLGYSLQVIGKHLSITRSKKI